MSAVQRKPKPDPDKAAQVVHDLAKLRPKIAKARAKLEKLYGEQKGLYVDGHLAGAPIAQMAKAGGPDYEVGDQAVRSVIRRYQATGERPKPLSG